MIGTVVIGHTFTAIIGFFCTFLSVLLAIYAIRYIINNENQRKFKEFAFSSAIFAAIAYLILLFILDA